MNKSKYRPDVTESEHITRLISSNGARRGFDFNFNFLLQIVEDRKKKLEPLTRYSEMIKLSCRNRE